MAFAASIERARGASCRPGGSLSLQLLFFILLDDFLFYWMHRSLHESRWLFKKVHSTHHRIMTPWAITGNYMHPARIRS